MARESFKVSAPGSLMLLGEYAVLNGHPALLCAIDQRITVTLTPQDDHRVQLVSDLAEHSTTLETLEAHPKLAFVMTALQQASSLPSGFSLSIESEFSSLMGLGSSAAVTVATCQAIQQWLGQTVTPEALWQQAMDVVHAVQSKGSGADIAASILGGVLCFSNSPLQMTPIEAKPPLSIVFSGNKTSTTEALKRISLNTEWEQAMTDLTAQALPALREKNWALFGKLLNQGQDLMVKLGVSNDALAHIAQTLCQQDTIFGAKISGSGFGDCVIGLGESDNKNPLDYLPITIGTSGVKTHP